MPYSGGGIPQYLLYNRALGDKILKFGIVLGMGIVFSKSHRKENGRDLW